MPVALTRTCARLTLLMVTLLAAGPATARQAPAESANPLAALNEELRQVLADAGVPFTAEQERAIALMMEERRRASEELFGDLMDFRGGPTQGQEEDRLRSAIEWMRKEFIRGVADYLTPAQQAAWDGFQAILLEAPAADAPGSPQPPAQTQYIRINNNSFTAEDRNFGNGGSTEVIQRGGVGAWHGNAQLLLKDDALNARNPLASNEPPYQERRLNVDVSGPVIPGRLTSSLSVGQTESKNADTVRATLPDGVFALGITRPYASRSANSRNTFQLADAHSLGLNGWYGSESGKDQGVGGFTLPERASNSTWRGWNLELKQFSSLSSQSLFETRVQVSKNHGENVPRSDDVRINVLDAFNGGGAQNRSENVQRNYDFNVLYTRAGERLTLKTGLDGAHRNRRSASTNNFYGTFTFSSLDAYLAATPLTYRVNRGIPLIETSQLEIASFAQMDLRLRSQLTLMLGVRYDAQSNLDDFDNLAPRVALAYAPGQATVIRAGLGVFYNPLDIGMVENQRRFDGVRQFEIVIDNPSYPDPFAAGTLRPTFPSIRVTDPDLRSTSLRIGMLSLERTFFSNLLVTATYDARRELGRLRVRNLNAPFDRTAPTLRACRFDLPEDDCVRPDPTRGHVFNLESTGRELRHNFELEVRKRFSIFNASASYEIQRATGDVQGGAGTVAVDSYNLQGDRGRAPFPLHSVDATLNARLPLGIFLTARMDANSGRYYTITTGRDDNRDSNANDRPEGVAPNSEPGPKYLDFDFNISKAFFFRGSGTGPNVNVFANMTNAFNHVHYGTPSGVLTSPNFGRSTSASEPREIEAGVRFQF